MRILFGSFVIALLAALSTVALPLGRADLRAFEARSLMQSWSAKERVPSAAEWSQARDALMTAHRLDSAQPAYLEDLGRLYEARGDLQQALESQRAALARRPGSPYTWSNIALLKARLAKPDAEFERALQNAALLGPWEPGVQSMLADAGFAQWGALAPPMQAVVRANAARALRWQDKNVIEIARRHGRLDVLCGLPEMRLSPNAGACI